MQALTATAIAISIAAVGVRGYVQNQVYAVRQAAGKAQGIQLDRLAAAADNYVIQNFSPLTGGPGQILKADGVTPGTVVNKLVPTVQELVTLGYLQAAFNPTNFFSGGYTVSLGRLPLGCSYPNCSIGGTVSMSNAILSHGVPDAAVLGAAVLQVGADAGVSQSAAPGTISGVSGGWSLANPAGNVAGILAERVGENAQRYNTFVRRDGALPMTGNLNLGGQQIVNMGVQAANTVCPSTGYVAASAGGQVLSCQGGVWKTQGSMYWNDPVSTYSILPGTDAVGSVRMTLDTGRAFMWTGGAWSALAVDQSGNMTIPGTLTAAGGRVVAWNQVGEGGVLQLQGANGVNMFLESLNGTFRLVNNPWNAQLFSVDQTGNVVSAGRITAGEYVQINGTATEGAACSPNGLIAQNGAGLILSCQSGVWQKNGINAAAAVTRTLAASSTERCFSWSSPCIATAPAVSVSCNSVEALTSCSSTASGKTCYSDAVTQALGCDGCINWYYVNNHVSATCVH